jgi:hypothetical protein
LAWEKWALQQNKEINLIDLTQRWSATMEWIGRKSETNNGKERGKNYSHAEETWWEGAKANASLPVAVGLKHKPGEGTWF